ncbi:MAG TPA: AGE family epimerase/isomerase [Armatimonadota bacterium]|nr:AGE family epimerase/isomerase [Armatimonadota bacterium]
MADRQSPRPRHPGQPEADLRKAQRLGAEIRSHLIDDVMPFWSRYALLPDRSGFRTALARDGTPTSDSPPSVVAVARLTYSFALAAEMTGREEYRSNALIGARSLLRYYDLDLQMWRWLPPQANVRPDRLRRPYGSIFAVYALAACGRITSTPEFVELAANSFRLLCQKGREQTLGGFFSEIALDWTPRELHHRLDTHLHAMEACSALLAATGGAEWKKLLLELAMLVAGRAFDPVSGSVREQFLPDWSEDIGVTGGQVNYGRNAEAAWFLGQAARALEEPGLADVGRRILVFILEEDRARPRDPGFAQGGRKGQNDPGAGFLTLGQPRRSANPALSSVGAFPSSGSEFARLVEPRDGPSYIWWVQTQALAALAHYYRRLPSPELLARLEDLWGFIHAYFYDPEFGEWFTRVGLDGSIVDDRKGADWKVAYHTVQGCAYAAAALDGLHIPVSAL